MKKEDKDNFSIVSLIYIYMRKTSRKQRKMSTNKNLNNNENDKSEKMNCVKKKRRRKCLSTSYNAIISKHFIIFARRDISIHRFLCIFFSTYYTYMCVCVCVFTVEVLITE